MILKIEKGERFDRWIEKGKKGRKEDLIEVKKRKERI